MKLTSQSFDFQLSDTGEFDTDLGIPSGPDTDSDHEHHHRECESQLWQDYDDDHVQCAITFGPASDHNYKRYKSVSSIYVRLYTWHFYLWVSP
jgi:hypothetical protein